MMSSTSTPTLTPHQTQLFQSLLNALQIIHSGASRANTADGTIIQNTIREAQAQCERIKSSAIDCIHIASYFIQYPSSILSLSHPSSTNALNPDIIQHFGVHCLQHIIDFHWSTLVDNDRNFMKLSTFQLLTYTCSQASSIPPTCPRFIREKVAAVVASLALREWPQQWEDFLPTIFNLCERYPRGGMQSVAWVIRDLADQLQTVLNIHLPEQRRRDVQNAMLNAMDDIILRFHNAIKIYYNEYTQHAQLQGTNNDSSLIPSAADICNALIQTITSMANWIPAIYWFQTGLLETFCQISTNPTFFLQLCEPLAAIASRKASTIDFEWHPQLFTLWRAFTDTTNAILSSSTLTDPSTMLEKCLMILSPLTRQHQYILALPTSSQLKMSFLTALGQLFAHPSIIVSSNALDLWLVLFRNDDPHILDDSLKKPLMEQLFHIVFRRLTKAKIDEVDQISEFNTSEEYNNFFGNYRGLLLILVTVFAQLDPIYCFEVTNARLISLFTAPPPNDHLNQYGYVSTQTSRFLDVEAAIAVLENIFKTIDASQVNANAPLANTLELMLSNIIQWRVTDPLLETRRILSLSFFSPLYSFKSTTFTAAVQECLTMMEYRPPKEMHLPLRGLSEDTRSCRRRAIHSLTHIIRKCPHEVILPHLSELTQRLQLLGNSGALLEAESILLYELYGVMSTHLPTPKDKKAFVDQLLASANKVIYDPQLKAFVSTPSDFLQFIGCNSQNLQIVQSFQISPDTEKVYSTFKRALLQSPIRQFCLQFITALQTYVGVFRYVCVPDNRTTSEENHHPSIAAFYEILPLILRVLALTYMVQSTDLRTAVPSEYVDVIAPHPLQPKRSKAESIKSSAILHAEVIKSVLDSFSDVSTTLYQIAARSGNAFYRQLDSSIFVESIIKHISQPYMQLLDLRFVIERVVAPLMIYCPEVMLESKLSKILMEFMKGVIERIDFAWNELIAIRTKTTNIVVSEQQEIAYENLIRDCTRAYVESFLKVANNFDLTMKSKANDKNSNVSRSTPASKQNPSVSVSAAEKISNEHPLEECALFQCLLSNSALSDPFLNSLRYCLQWPDVVARGKAIRILIRLIPLCPKRRNTHTIVLDIFDLVLLKLSSHEYRPQLISSDEIDLITFCKEVYDKVGKRTNHKPRSILSSKYNASAEDLKQFEHELNQPQGDKIHKKFMKSLLEKYVCGKNVSPAEKHFAEQSDIKNLEGAPTERKPHIRHAFQLTQSNNEDQENSLY